MKEGIIETIRPKTGREGGEKAWQEDWEVVKAEEVGKTRDPIIMGMQRHHIIKEEIGSNIWRETNRGGVESIFVPHRERKSGPI